MLQEQDIIIGCQKKDNSAQRALVVRYSPMLLTTVRRYINDANTAKDVLQNALIQILDYLPRFKIGEGSFEGWLRRIAVTTALKELRKPNYKLIDSWTESHENGQLIDPTIYQQLGMEDLLQLIADLPEGSRTVFNLYVMEEYSHREIGELLQITESTSRSQLTRARAMLQEKLKQLGINLSSISK